MKVEVVGMKVGMMFIKEEKVAILEGGLVVVMEDFPISVVCNASRPWALAIHDIM